MFLVTDGPEISCISIITLLEGEPFNPNCTVKGHPQPEVTWWKDDQPIDLPLNISRYDDGQYILVANNTNNSSHTLDVIVDCKWITHNGKLGINCK